MRITCFATNTPARPVAELEFRHRLRARAEDRIRAARTTGLGHLPLHTAAQNKVWLEIVQIVPPAGLDARACPHRQGPTLGTPPPAIPPVLRGRPARHNRSAQDSPPHPALALDRRDHHRPRTTRAVAHPRLTSSLPPSRVVEPGAPPKATTGPPACPSSAHACEGVTQDFLDGRSAIAHTSSTNRSPSGARETQGSMAPAARSLAVSRRSR